MYIFDLLPQGDFQPVLREFRPCCAAVSSDVEAAGFVDVSREYLAQLGFPSEVISARLPPI